MDRVSVQETRMTVIFQAAFTLRYLQSGKQIAASFRFYLQDLRTSKSSIG